MLGEIHQKIPSEKTQKKCAGTAGLHQGLWGWSATPLKVQFLDAGTGGQQLAHGEGSGDRGHPAPGWGGTPGMGGTIALDKMQTYHQFL